MADGNLTGIRPRNRRRIVVAVVSPAASPEYIGDPDDETTPPAAAPALDYFDDYGGGSPQAVTTTPANLLPGGTEPFTVLAAAGTYLIFATMQFEATGATVTNQTLGFELARNNNSPATIANSSVVIDLPPMTTATQTIGAFHLPAVVYVTANDDDEIVIVGLISGALGAGSIDASGGSIVAVKIG